MIADRSLSSKIMDVIVYTTMIVVLVTTLYPVLYVVSASLSSASANDRGLVTIFPVDFNIDAYIGIFSMPTLTRAFTNSVIITASGTAINMFFTTTYAYALSRKKLALRGFYTVVAMIPMYFSGGLIPSFLLITRTLHLYNSWWALILPGAISTTNMIIMRSFFVSLPAELEESAYLDGANDIVIFYKIILPLSKAVLFTIGLYYLVGHWNSWFNAMIFLQDRSKYPLQLFLREILLSGSMTDIAAGSTGEDVNNVLTMNMLKYCTIVVSTLPILCIYPFLQKYFVKGVMIGSVKE